MPKDNDKIKVTNDNKYAFETLGITKKIGAEVSRKEENTAYKKTALKLHPDKAPDSQNFTDVSDAHEALKDDFTFDRTRPSSPLFVLDCNELERHIKKMGREILEYAKRGEGNKQIVLYNQQKTYKSQRDYLKARPVLVALLGFISDIKQSVTNNYQAGNSYRDILFDVFYMCCLAALELTLFTAKTVTIKLFFGQQKAINDAPITAAHQKQL
ncbi:MAG: DnaJ domain-containing protein [Legionella sp.]|nr:DnaJ domain-containing protein [Legionella sp.]